MYPWFCCSWNTQYVPVVLGISLQLTCKSSCHTYRYSRIFAQNGLNVENSTWISESSMQDFWLRGSFCENIVFVWTRHQPTSISLQDGPTVEERKVEAFGTEKFIVTNYFCCCLFKGVFVKRIIKWTKLLEKQNQLQNVRSLLAHASDQYLIAPYHNLKPFAK